MIEQPVKLGRSAKNDRPCTGAHSGKAGLDQPSPPFGAVGSFLKAIFINMENNIAIIIIIVYEARCASINHTNECQLMVMH